MRRKQLTSSIQAYFHPDRIGVWASVLCGVHCLITPFLLLALPSFGQMWSHPIAHWLIAALVVPLALWSIHKAYRQHGRKWIPICGYVGVALVLVGAAYPSLAKTPLTLVDSAQAAPQPQSFTAETAPSEPTSTCSHGCTDCAPQPAMPPSPASTDASPACTDACCPTITTDAEGNAQLQIPTAAVITTLGGLFLISAHTGNLITLRKTGHCPTCTA